MRQTEYRRLTRALNDQLLEELTSATQAELNWLFRQMQYKIRRINQFRPRVGSERPKLQKSYVVSGDLWSLFESRMRSVIMRLLMLGVIRLKDLNRKRFWGKPIEFDSEEFARMIEPQVGKRITHVSNTIKREVGRKVVGWYNSPGSTMQSLVDQLKDRFGESRARMIAQNEVTFLNSEVTRRIGEQIGATDWWWSTRNDNVVCKKPIKGPDGKMYKGCRELHGKVFKIGMLMPPKGSHIGCRCGAVLVPPVVRTPERVKEIIEGLMIQKYDPDQPRDKNGRWTDAGGSGSDNNEVIGRTFYLHLPIQRITDASRLMEYGAVIVGEKGGGEVYAVKDAAIDHRVIIDAVRAYKKLSPEYKMNEDDFVRFTVQRNYSNGNKQLFVATSSAGIGWSFINDWEERALKNIYKALDRLISLGLPKDTEVYIHRDYGKPIRTTAKLDSPGDLAKWDESQHPRDDEGKWTEKGTGTAGGGDKHRQAILSGMSGRWKGYTKIFRDLDMDAGTFDRELNELIRDGVIEHRESKSSGTYSDIDLYRIKQKQPKPAHAESQQAGVERAPAHVKGMEKSRKEADERIVEFQEKYGMSLDEIAREGYQWRNWAHKYKDSPWEWAMWEKSQEVAEKIGYKYKENLTTQDILDDPTLDSGLLGMFDEEFSRADLKADSIITARRNSNIQKPLIDFLNTPEGKIHKKITLRTLWGEVVANGGKEIKTKNMGAARHFDTINPYPGMQELANAKSFDEAMETPVTIYRGISEHGGDPENFKPMNSFTTSPEIAKLFAEGYAASYNKPGTGIVIEVKVKFGDIATYINMDYEYEVVIPEKPLKVVNIVRKWDEQKHPRHGKGSDKGGQFAPKGQGGAAEPAKPRKLTPPRTRNTAYGQQVSYAAPNPDVDNLPEVIKWRKKHYYEAMQKLMNFALDAGIDTNKFNAALIDYANKQKDGDPLEAYKAFSKAAHKIMDGKVDAADYLRLENAIRVADWRFIKGLGEKPKPKPKPEPKKPEPKPEAWRPHPISDEEWENEKDYIKDARGDKRKEIPQEQWEEYLWRSATIGAAKNYHMPYKKVSIKKYIDDYFDAGYFPIDPARPYVFIDGQGNEKEIGDKGYSVLARNYIDMVMNRGKSKRSYDIATPVGGLKPNPKGMSGADAAQKIVDMFKHDESPELKALGKKADEAGEARSQLSYNSIGYTKANRLYQEAKTTYTIKYREEKKQREEAVAKMLKADKPATFGVNLSITDQGLLKRAQTGVEQVKNVLSSDVSLWHDFVNIVELQPNKSGKRVASCYKTLSNSVEADASDKRDEVVPHELGHWIEDNNRYARRAVIDFLKRRTAGETAVKINSLRGKSGFDDDEICKPDKFFDVYCGKIYLSGDTEILSMGIAEYISNPVEFAKKDKEYFALIYDILHGAYEK